jgi:hypothetical protein
MARTLRRLALAGALVLAALWLAPALLLPVLGPRLGNALGVTLAFEGVRPDFPFGIAIERVHVTREGRSLELTDLRARLASGGARIDTRLGDGTVLLRLEGLRGRSGFLRVESLPVEQLDGVLPGALGLRGPLDGVYRFGAQETLEATVGRGAGVLHAPIAVELGFRQLVVAAERLGDGAWRVDFADLRGPPVSATARGTIGVAGELALELEVSQLDEPARSAFASAGLSIGEIPWSGQVRGTVALPLFVAAAR